MRKVNRLMKREDRLAIKLPELFGHIAIIKYFDKFPSEKETLLIRPARAIISRYEKHINNLYHNYDDRFIESQITVKIARNLMKLGWYEQKFKSSEKLKFVSTENKK